MKLQLYGIVSTVIYAVLTSESYPYAVDAVSDTVNVPDVV
jgi:hypothetical protein